jgi:hypothetical protein
MVHKSSGGVFSFTMDEFRRWTGVPANPTDAVYVRAELYGRGSAMAWTQPFWIEQE